MRGPAGPPDAPRPGVLLVGNFLSATSQNRQVCEDLAVVLEGRGWPVIATSSKTPRVARAADMVTTALRSRRRYAVANVEVFSGPSFAWAEAVCAVLRVLDKPYVLTLHGGSLPRFARRHPVRVRSLLSGAAVVTTPSRYLLERMTPYRSDLVLIPNPIDIGRYPARIRRRPAARLVWLRAFHRIYNPTLAPRVLAMLRPSHPDITLTMVGPDRGDGSLEEVRAAAEALCVSDRLVHPGGVDKTAVPRWLSEGDVFLNTTNVDNSPVSVIEAMACGLCVVSTDVDGIPYLVEDEVDGLLVPPDDPPSMAAAVERILSEDGLAERLSRNARAKAQAYDWSRVLPAWERLFGGLASGGRRPA